MKHKHSPTDNIGLAFFLNFVFTLVEVFGGFLTNSVAILSDALHDLGDSVSLGLAFYFSRLSQRKGTSVFTYGFKRFSLVSAIVNCLVLFAGAFYILSKAVPRLFTPEEPHAPGMLIFAIAGIVVNGIAAVKLRCGKTMNERVVTWHLFEDVLGWAAVLIVSLVLLVKNVYILDPLLSILITLYVLWNVVKNFKKTLWLFLQGVPESIDVDFIEKNIKAIEEALDVHDTHIWSLDGEHHILTTHIVVPKGISKTDLVALKCRIKELLHQVEIAHATLEFEYEDERCQVR